ncbi:MAG TPA: hypothetical protein VF600_06975 [Abditibacteriaceae bacterium]|jgi:hypothetical protein
MIVYGDPSFQEPASVLVERLRVQVAALQAVRPQLDDLRTLLISAGQLEQAVHDAIAGPQLDEREALLQQVESATTQAALAFYAGWNTGQKGLAPATISTAEALSSLASTLNGMRDLPAQPITVKIPEGFAFYTLYPEQYCLATLSWINQHREEPEHQIIVVGVRSIGTSLSALVLATLRNVGWPATRVTVRPSGHPFERHCDLRKGQLSSSASALVVDEGPGISGSSMASVADALVKCGIERSRITFLPGHGGEPGYAASASVRQWWVSVPRYVAEHDELRWGDCSLQQLLARETAQLCGEEVVNIEDAGGGLWRRAAYRDEQSWPAVCALFERAKYLCTTRNGRRVFWKFMGLTTHGSSGDVFSQWERRAVSGWTPAPLARVAGFVATPWLDGTPSQHDADASTLQHIAQYLAGVAGEPLTTEEQRTAVNRLQEMLYWNTHEALGEAVAERVKNWCRATVDFSAQPWPRYVDGRMAPHEWLRTPDHKLIKTDSVGHDTDHTIVGPQAWLWDVAGTMSEWNLEEEHCALFLQELANNGLTVPVHALAFYRMAYAAFRLGQCTMCAEMSTHDPNEQRRLGHAATIYKTQLTTLLETVAP